MGKIINRVRERQARQASRMANARLDAALVRLVERRSDDAGISLAIFVGAVLIMATGWSLLYLWWE